MSAAPKPACGSTGAIPTVCCAPAGWRHECRAVRAGSGGTGHQAGRAVLRPDAGADWQSAHVTCACIVVPSRRPGGQQCCQCYPLRSVAVSQRQACVQAATQKCRGCCSQTPCKCNAGTVVVSIKSMAQGLAGQLKTAQDELRARQEERVKETEQQVQQKGLSGRSLNQLLAHQARIITDLEHSPTPLAMRDSCAHAPQAGIRLRLETAAAEASARSSMLASALNECRDQAKRAQDEARPARTTARSAVLRDIEHAEVVGVQAGCICGVFIELCPVLGECESAAMFAQARTATAELGRVRQLCSAMLASS